MEPAQRYIEKSVIEIAPLAYMRGRTLDDSFIILDEAQNTTPEQMKMFLTRIGFNSRAVITGDVTQIDIGKSHESGLVSVQRILKGVAGISFLYLTKVDIVRHPVVQRIIQAYEEAEERKSQLTYGWDYVALDYGRSSSWDKGVFLADGGGDL
jgi:phosphate starvation-inducible PhoH-like protein